MGAPLLRSIRTAFQDTRLRVDILTFLLCVASVLTIFGGIWRGYIIANCGYVFNFEPWIHYRGSLEAGETVNPVFSDSMDGADANLNPTNIKPFSVAHYLQFNHAIKRALMSAFGHYHGLSHDGVILFVMLMFFTYLYLRRIGTNWPIAFAVSLGFTFGSTNMHLHLGWAYETTCAVIALYFVERLLQRNTWWDALWATLAFVNLGGCVMVHIVAFWAVVFALYIVTRALVSEDRFGLLSKFALAGLFSLLLSVDHLWPTLSYYSDNFEKGYRDNYGLRQNDWRTIFTFIIAYLYGHPRVEMSRWALGSYINVGMFIGSIVAFSAVTAGVLRSVLKRDFHAIFFTLATIFGACYVYAFPFESIESYIGTLPLLRWAPSLYFKCVLHLFVAVLGALGLQYLWSNGSRFVAVLCALGAGTTLWFAKAHVDFMNTYFQGSTPYLDKYLPHAYDAAVVSIILIAILGFLKTLRLESNRIAGAVCGAALISVVGYETWISTDGWIPYAKPERCGAKTQSTDFIKRHATQHSRIQGLGYAGVPAMINMPMYGVETAAGRMSVKTPYLYLLQEADPAAYSGNPTQYLFTTDTNLHSPVWDLTDVRFFVAPRSMPVKHFTERHAPGSIKAHVLRDGIILERRPAPRHAYILQQARVFKNPGEMATVVRQGWNVREVIALESDSDLIPQQLSGPSDPDPKARVVEFKKSTNRLEATYESSREAYILLSEMYNPNWKAYINGQPVKTFRAYFFLQGVVVPAGTNTVELRYELPGQPTANAVVLTTALLLLMGCLWGLWRRRKLKRQA